MAGDLHRLDSIGLVIGAIDVATPLLLGIPVGLAAGRLARRAALADSRRQGVAEPGRAPVIEATTVVIVVAMIARFGTTIEMLPTVVVVIAIVATGSTDLRNHRIPNRIVYPSLVSAGALMAGVAIAMAEPMRLGSAAAGAAWFGAILFGVHLAMPRGLGRGDAKLGFLLGAAIGWHRPASLLVLEPVVWSLLAASALGLAWALARHLLAPPGTAAPLRRQRIPFGPVLSAATIGVVGVADVLVR